MSKSGPFQTSTPLPSNHPLSGRHPTPPELARPRQGVASGDAFNIASLENAAGGGRVPAPGNPLTDGLPS